MLKISPVFDLKEKDRLCKKCDATSFPNALTYIILSDGIEIGVCQFKLCENGGRILILRNTIDCNDNDALVIAGRAALDFIERNSGFDAYYDDNNSSLAATRLGFKDGKLDLHGYFGSCPGCAKH